MKNKDKNLSEKELQLRWKNIKSGTELLSASGEKIRILSTGKWNFEEGPDFINAKFIKDNHIITGDIEIHINSSCWLAHGHSNNPLYKNVKIHVVSNDDVPQLAKELGVETIIISSYAKSVKNQNSYNKKFSRGKCSKIFAEMDDQSLYKLFSDAGEKWFKDKAQTLLAELISVGFDHAVLRRIFEAAGYKKNKDNFLKLFDRFVAHGKITDLEHPEAVLWGESGLLPDPTTKKVHPEMKSYARSLWQKWWKYRFEAQKPIKWVKSGVRPLNSPERRLAALCALIEKTDKGRLFEKFSEIRKLSCSETNFVNELIKLLNAEDPLWNYWTNFKDKRNIPASLLGEMRALDIVVNVILPALFAKFAIEKDYSGQDICLNIFRSCPMPQENIRIKTAANKWLTPPSRAKVLIKDAVSAQGAIYILKNYCEKNFEFCDNCSFLAELKDKTAI